MKQQTTSLVNLGGLVVVAVVLATSTASVTRLDHRISQLIASRARIPFATMQTISEDVKRPSGRVTTITTTQATGETPDELLARHDALVALAAASG